MNEPTPIAPRYRSLPVQIVALPDGVLLARGAVRIRVGGEAAAEALRTVLLAASVEGGGTREELLALFAAPDRPAIGALFDRLVGSRVLLPVDEVGGSAGEEPEGPLDLFYWNLGTSAIAAAARLEGTKIVVVGANAISRRLVAALEEGGFPQVQVVDDPLLRNLRFFDDDGGLRRDRWPAGREPLSRDAWLSGAGAGGVGALVATSDFGAHVAIADWNRVAVSRGWVLLPVVLDRLLGRIGPLVVPGEGPCYECFRARESSNCDEAPLLRAAEPFALERQAVDGFHPALASIAAEIALLELIRFFGGTSLPPQVGTLVEVNALASSMTPRRLLRVPRCPVCGDPNRFSSTTLDRLSFVPGNRFDAHHPPGGEKR
jgi:bacteriocin biosynthesis cyclodehydratase domain-containing protein